MEKERRIIGLTGGIATGKSTVSNYLKKICQWRVVDADDLARDAVVVGSEILGKIVERYGKNILFADGNLNRLKLGEIIFTQAQERQWLESQIHPYVRDRILESIAVHDFQTPLVLSIPLLFEAKMTDLVTEIWVVYCPTGQQIERLMLRNHLTPTQAQARISAQMPLASKCQQADVILDNSSTLDALMRQIPRAIQSA